MNATTKVLECCTKCERLVFAQAGRRKLPKGWKRRGKRAVCGLCGNPGIVRGVFISLQHASEVESRPVAAVCVGGHVCMVELVGRSYRTRSTKNLNGTMNTVAWLIATALEYCESGDVDRLKENLQKAVSALE